MTEARERSSKEPPRRRPGRLLPPGPVSAALDLPVDPLLAEQVRRALAAIDAVHADGALPALPLDRRGVMLGADGCYRYKGNTGRAQGIGINQSSSDPELTIVHEIGHVLDHQALGNRGGFASKRHPHLEGWRQAVTATRAYQWLRETKHEIQAERGDTTAVDYLIDYLNSGRAATRSTSA